MRPPNPGVEVVQRPGLPALTRAIRLTQVLQALVEFVDRLENLDGWGFGWGEDHVLGIYCGVRFLGFDQGDHNPGGQVIIGSGDQGIAGLRRNWPGDWRQG